MCAIKYISDTRYYCYQMKLDGNINGPWYIREYIDADYAGDNNTLKSVTGYIIIIHGAVVSLCS